MAALRDEELRQAALAYVIEIYDELTAQNAAPTLGTQNQVVDFILADAELREAVAAWAGTRNFDEKVPAPPTRVPQDRLYQRVRAFMLQIMEPAVMIAPGQDSG